MIIDASDIAERAAFLEFCCGMTRDAAEQQAIADRQLGGIDAALRRQASGLARAGRVAPA